jgi:hypothetical protein
MSQLMARHAPFHSDRNLQRDSVVLIHGAVTLLAIGPGFDMPRVAEIYKILDRVHLLYRKRPGIGSHRREPPDLGAVPVYRAVAGHAFRDRGEQCLFARFNRRMAVLALDLQGRVPLVAELHPLTRASKRRYGKK